MKRLVCAAVAAAGCLVLPAGASAAIHQIELNEATAIYCVAVDTGPVGVTFTARAPGGGTVATVRGTTLTPGVNCDGAATPGAGAFTVSFDAPSGTQVTADAGGSVTTTFPVPYGSYDGAGGTGTFKLANLPAAGGSTNIAGSVHSYTGTTYTTASPITVGSGAVDMVSTVAGVAYTAHFNAFQFSIQTTYYGSVAVYGGDPLGAAISVSITGGGGPAQSTTIATAVDHDQYDEAQMPYGIPPGAVVTVTQPGWFSHTLTTPMITASPSAVSMSIPAVAGESATANFSSYFQPNGSAAAPGSPLSCLAFGDASFMSGHCGTAVARYTSTFPLFFSPLDYASLDVTEPDGDRGSSEVRGTGFSSYPDDGSAGFSGATPSSVITLTATNPAHATASVSGVTYDDGTAYFGGEGSGYLPTRLVSGTSVVASGPAVGTPRAYSVDLELHASGSIVAGTTYPGGHVSVSEQRPAGSSATFYGIADGNGAFSFDVGALEPRDSVSVHASDPSGASVTSRSLFPGIPQPVIQGLTDQQLVHGTVSVSASVGGPAGILWGGDGSGGLAAAAPFTYLLDTTLLTDGAHRLTADTAGAVNSMRDYLYVRVDNTPPSVSAGPSQNAAIGSPTVLLPGAHDANGMASLSVSFGDGSTLALSGDAIGQPVRHVYAKGGTFTETVTGTDAAGNTASATAVVHVIGSLAEQVSGKLPSTFKQAKKLKKRKNLSVTFTSHMAGVLRVRLLNSSYKVRASQSLTFAAANAKARLTVGTKKWARGRYLVVLQFTDADGLAGPVVLQTLRIR